MKKVVSILCLLVLTIQVLPLRQVGSLLSSNQMTEELPHSCCGIEKAVDLKFEPVKQDYFDGHLALSAFLSEEQYIHFASSLPDNHEGEIQTPPPNFV